MKIEEQTRPFATEMERLDMILGADRRVAEVLLAEVGADVKPFRSDQHLSSWAGMCPGNEESAGKQTRRGLRRACSTVSREVARHGGRSQYRASEADSQAVTDP